MLPDYAYHWTFISISVLLCLIHSITLRKYNSFEGLYYRSGTLQSALFLICCVILFIGTRPLSEVFPDMVPYVRGYLSGNEQVSEIRNEPVWMSIMIVCRKLGFPVSLWFFTITLMSLGLKFYAYRRIFKNNVYLAILFMLTAFSFWSGAVVILRNDMALSMVLGGIALFCLGRKKQKVLAGVFFVLAFYTHTSSTLLIVSFIASYFWIKNIKWSIAFWLLCVLLSLTMGSFFENLFMSVGFDDRLSGYLTEKDYSGFAHAGFRWDFLLYSVMPVVLGWYVIKRVKVDRMYEILLNTYILANSFWVLVIRAQFSDRFAAISWFIYPILIAYPILKFKIWQKQPNVVANILLAHVGFIVVMQIMYSLR